MIGSTINTIDSVLLWIIGAIADVAYFFSRVAYYAGQLPGVGNYLSNYFTSIQAAFNDWGYFMTRLRTYLINALWAIDDWLDDMYDLANYIYGWFTDRVDDAYSWANSAWDWVVDTGEDLASDVYGWIQDRVNDAYHWADNALDWIASTGMDLYRDVTGWITDQLTDAWTWANDAWTWIQDNAPNLPDLPQLIQDAVLAIVGPVFNLVSLWFDDINAFFTDPVEFMLTRLVNIAKRYEQTILDIVDKIGDVLWGG